MVAPSRLGRIRRARLRLYLLGRRRIVGKTMFGHFMGTAVLVNVVANLVDRHMADDIRLLFPVLIYPSVAGRLHDGGRSDWWGLVPAVTLLAASLMSPHGEALAQPAKLLTWTAILAAAAFSIKLLSTPTEMGRNRYGPDPRKPKDRVW